MNRRLGVNHTIVVRLLCCTEVTYTFFYINAFMFFIMTWLWAVPDQRRSAPNSRNLGQLGRIRRGALNIERVSVECNTAVGTAYFNFNTFDTESCTAQAYNTRAFWSKMAAAQVCCVFVLFSVFHFFFFFVFGISPRVLLCWTNRDIFLTLKRPHLIHRFFYYYFRSDLMCIIFQFFVKWGF